MRGNGITFYIYLNEKKNQNKRAELTKPWLELHICLCFLTPSLNKFAMLWIFLSCITVVFRFLYECLNGRAWAWVNHFKSKQILSKKYVGFIHVEITQKSNQRFVLSLANLLMLFVCLVGIHTTPVNSKQLERDKLWWYYYLELLITTVRIYNQISFGFLAISLSLFVFLVYIYFWFCCCCCCCNPLDINLCDTLCVIMTGIINDLSFVRQRWRNARVIYIIIISISVCVFWVS